MKKIFLLLFLSMPLFVLAQHQHGQWCGMTMEEAQIVKQRLMENRQAVANGEIVRSRAETVYIPVRFIMVTDSDGTNAPSEVEALRGLCLLNETYEPLDMVFFLEEFSYLASTEVNDNARSLESLQIMADYLANRYDAINMFINSTPVPPPPGGGGITLGFYRPAFGQQQNDYIVVKRTELNNPIVIPHEVGHFFSLSHPFLGWEGNRYDDSNPTPAPSISPGGIPTELADSSNCDEAADAICDTPADYLFAFSPGYTGNCNYMGGALDPAGQEVVNTLENNIMSYFQGCTPYQFTPDQQAAILDDYNSFDRFYLKFGVSTPNLTPINEDANPLKPADGETLTYYNAVEFDWSDVPGADAYVFEIDRLPAIGATSEFQRIIVTGGSSIIVDNLNPDVTYFWRVLPYNATQTCSGYSEVSSVTTGLIVNTTSIESLEGWMISPNPVVGGQSMQLTVETTRALDARFDLLNLNGQRLESAAQLLTQGRNVFEWNTAELTPGVYIIRMETEEGVSSKRFVVQ